MNHQPLFARITARPDVFSGKPIIRDMRISDESIICLLTQGPVLRRDPAKISLSHSARPSGPPLNRSSAI
jgi:hypothetical protein